jgi:glyceraldehyde 3-phosphate dehydrogenase (phosphorylating)
MSSSRVGRHVLKTTYPTAFLRRGGGSRQRPVRRGNKCSPVQIRQQLRRLSGSGRESRQLVETTNGLAPVAKVLFDRFGIERGLLTTLHAYTGSQRLLDVASKDPRDARAAALNIVPSETGAARAVGLDIPELRGKFGGMAFRVPVPTVSVIDFTAVLGREPSRDEINAAMREYAGGTIIGILGYSEEPLVSSDLKGDSRSSVFSGLDTLVIGNLAKLVSWYDNECGYACRLADLTALVAERLPEAHEVQREAVGATAR